MKKEGALVGVPSFLYGLDHAAGDPAAAVSGGLGVEIIRHIMHDDRFSDHVGRPKSVRVDSE